MRPTNTSTVRITNDSQDKMTVICKRFTLIMLLPLIAMLALAGSASADENPALWKFKVSGHFDAVLEDLKSGLEAGQFVITGEENLAKALAKNRHIIGEDKWNIIGFQNATAVHFCSLLFNHEVFNINMDWSIMCPFKVVAYSMKSKPEDVTIVMARPTYLLHKDPHPRAEEMSKKIEDRIVGTIKDTLAK